MKIEYIIFLALSIIVGSQLLMNNTNVLGVKIESKEKKTELGDFPTPQLSTGYKQLSKNLVNNPYTMIKSKPINEDINIIRTVILQTFVLFIINLTFINKIYFSEPIRINSTYIR